MILIIFNYILLLWNFLVGQSNNMYLLGSFGPKHNLQNIYFFVKKKVKICYSK